MITSLRTQLHLTNQTADQESSDGTTNAVHQVVEKRGELSSSVFNDQEEELHEKPGRKRRNRKRNHPRRSEV
jgi:hypothetical protein